MGVCPMMGSQFGPLRGVVGFQLWPFSLRWVKLKSLCLSNSGRFEIWEVNSGVCRFGENFKDKKILFTSGLRWGNNSTPLYEMGGKQF